MKPTSEKAHKISILKQVKAAVGTPNEGSLGWHTEPGMSVARELILENLVIGSDNGHIVGVQHVREAGEDFIRDNTFPGCIWAWIRGKSGVVLFGAGYLLRYVSELESVKNWASKVVAHLLP